MSSVKSKKPTKRKPTTAKQRGVGRRKIKLEGIGLEDIKMLADILESYEMEEAVKQYFRECYNNNIDDQRKVWKKFKQSVIELSDLANPSEYEDDLPIVYDNNKQVEEL